MKKGKICIVVLIGLLLVGGLVLVGCGNKCSEDGNCSLKSDSGANVLEARSCFMSECNTTKQADNEPGPNITVSCNCK